MELGEGRHEVFGAHGHEGCGFEGGICGSGKCGHLGRRELLIVEQYVLDGAVEGIAGGLRVVFAVGARGADEKRTVVLGQALFELGLGGGELAVHIDHEAGLAEGDGEVVLGAGLDGEIGDGEILGFGIGLLADLEGAVLDPGGEMAAVLIARAVLGEEGVVAGDRVGGKSHRQGPVRYLHRSQMTRIQIVRPVPRQRMSSRYSKNGGSVTNNAKRAEVVRVHRSIPYSIRSGLAGPSAFPARLDPMAALCDGKIRAR